MNPLHESETSVSVNTPASSTPFDYIIVGAGSGGCVVARRLVERTDARILVLEAGGSDTNLDRITNPLRWLENIGSPQDYLYPYQPTPHVNNRVIYAPRGKGLGDRQQRISDRLSYADTTPVGSRG